MQPKLDTTLSYWQSKQAAMFCYFTSVDYLKTLHWTVCDLINGLVDPLLATADGERRDTLLTDPQWGTRRTSDNWVNNAWPVLKDLQTSVANSLAARQNNMYVRPAVDEFLHGIDEFSLEWATPAEEELFANAVKKIDTFAGWLDDTLAKEELSRWNDFDISFHFPAFHELQPRIPRFKVRLDVSAHTGSLPPVTGVYVALDDPNATLQFAFAENGGRKLRKANTFNDLGLDALQFVGRDALWTDHQKMFEFATLQNYQSIFYDQIFLQGKLQPTLARVAVKRAAITARPAKWYLVEELNEDWAADSSQDAEASVPAESH